MWLKPVLPKAAKLDSSGCIAERSLRLSGSRFAPDPVLRIGPTPFGSGGRHQRKLGYKLATEKPESILKEQAAAKAAVMFD